MNKILYSNSIENCFFKFIFLHMYMYFFFIRFWYFSIERRIDKYISVIYLKETILSEVNFTFSVLSIL